MNRVKKITYSGIMMALVFVATAIIPHIPIPRGYINFGDGVIFTAAILFGWQVGAIAGGIGSALADIFLGYTQWALPTLIIKGIMGAVVGIMANPINKKVNNIIISIFGIGWIILNFILYNLLGETQKLKPLVNELELSSMDALMILVSEMRTMILTAVIAIPIAIIVLAIIFNKKDKQLFSVNTLTGITLGGICMISGYYIAEVIIYGNILVPIFGLPLSFLQFFAGIIVAYLIVLPLRKAQFR